MKNYVELSDIFHVPSLDEKMIALAKRLKDIRKRCGYSQTELADRAGISFGSIKRFERTGEISLRHLWKLAEALECERDLTQLFTNVPLTRRDIWGNEDE